MTSLRNIEPKLVVKLQPFGTERVITVKPQFTENWKVEVNARIVPRSILH